ncbi:MAG: MMPL family transporter [Acidobacteriota bacterium]
MIARSPLLGRLALFARRRYRAVFLGALLCFAIAGLLTAGLEFDTDVLHLLPVHDPAVKTFTDTIEQFESLDNLLVVVRVPEGAVLDRYQAFVDRLGERLQKVPSLQQITYKLDAPEDLLASFLPKSLLFLNESSRPALLQRLSDEGLHSRVSELRRQLSAPQAIAVKELAKLDPAGISEVLLSQMGSNRGSLQADWTSGYLLSGDHRIILLLGKPIKPPQDIDFTRGLIDSVNHEIEATRAEWHELAGDDAGAAPEVVLGGGYMIALSDASLIQSELALNMGTSAIGVLLLFFFAFRRWAALAYPIIPLGGGLLLAFGFARLAFGSLNSATGGVAALLIGMGIDFVIVSYGRYVEARRGGASVEDGLVTMSSTAGLAVFFGAVTTAATFYAFCVTDFRGLRQMGILAGTGILLCAVCVLVLLPALLAWSEERRLAKARNITLHLHTFGSDRLMRACQRRPGIALAIGVVVTVVAALLVPRIHFEDSMQKMRPAGNPGILVQEEVGLHFGSGFDQMMLVISGDSADEVLALSEKAAAGARLLVDRGILRSVEAATAMVPPEEHQKAALEWLAAERVSGALDPVRVKATFLSAAAAEGLRPEAFTHGLDMLAQALQPPDRIRVEDYARSSQTRQVLDRFIRNTKDGWKGIVYLYPPPQVWKREAPPQAYALARDLGPKVALTGINVMSTALRERVRREAIVAAVLGVLLVLAILWIDFRRLRPALLAFVPLLVGGTWMFGAMAAFGIDMNFMNIFVTTMIIGIATDYAIYILHRHEETLDETREVAEAALAETGKGVLLAALTTIVGFGSLATSHYPGLKSMGYVAGLGAGFTCLVSITLLPALLSLLRRGRDRRSPGAQ